MVVREEHLSKICSLLVKRDPDIVEIVQFGSSVYAPELGRDLDLLVFTRRRKDYGVYLDATADVYDELDLPFNIDVVPCGIGDSLNEGFVRNVLGAFSILFGDGSNLARYVKALGDPTFEEARAALRAGKRTLEAAMSEAEPLTKDRLVREAFDGLFHAARIASMVFLSIEVSRWGMIRRRLPVDYSSRFQNYITTLRIDYFYNGNYPKEKVGGEFDRWLRDIEEYVAQLERKTKAPTE